MQRKVITGKIQGNERGYAFLIPEDEKLNDYFIPHSDLRGAMHGDTVLCEETSGTGLRTTARVLKVLERGIDRLVGTYFSTRNGGFVVPDERKYYNDIFIPQNQNGKAKSGDKVCCRILCYPKNKNPEGLIFKILGRQFTFQAELKSIEYTYKCPEKFPKLVLEEANNLVEEIDLKGRKDFRNLTTYTIDGEDARDFDDAVSIEKLRDGNYLLGVHIADVSHYVKFFGEIDKEAFNRATSIYFPEKVIPMLPERLCNDLCSLVEGKDRLTLSCMMKIDGKGNVIDSEITPSVINSKARLTYTKVQKILDGDKKLKREYSKLVNDILLMNELCDILIKKREKNGSIDLDVKESSITVDENNNIIVSASLGRDKSHRIIEEFMILANVTVAEFMFFLDKPFIYRVHEKPTEERLEKFYAFITQLGIKFKRAKDNVYPKDFQLILNNCNNSPVFPIVNRVMLRSMQKAKYSPDNLGHFGLSEKNYCHFTSPIRRYPDLTIHRIIKDFLSGKQDLEEKYSNFVEEASKQSSLKERNAQEAERAVDDYYKIMYISNYVGEEFSAVVSGVTSFGVFCELENGIEGLCKLETLKGKRYTFDEKTFSLSNGKQTYKLGQSVKIKVAGVDFAQKKAEFLIVE